MEILFKISEIAKFLSITTTTLRHYEKEGIIKPCYVDAVTKYRYYNSKNINDISYIVLLRRSGITIPQIKNYLSSKSNITNILQDLNEQKTNLENTIKYFNSIEGKNDNTINIVSIKKTNYISNEYQIKSISDAYNKIQEFLTSHLTKCKIDIPLIFLEINHTFNQIMDLDVVIGIDVVDCDIKMSSRDETKALEFIHHGSYESLQNSYALMLKYAQENNIKLKGNIIHYFLESFTIRKNSTEFITKIIMPIE